MLGVGEEALTTSASIVNYSLELIGAQTTIGSLNDGTPAGNAAGVLYTPAVQMLLRQLDPDFARRWNQLALQAGGNGVPYWTYEYSYPSDCLRLRGLAPPASGAGALADPFDPQPIRGNVAIDLIASVATKVIFTNQQNAWAVFTCSDVTESQFDAAFIEALARQLANPLGMAVAGRPDYAKELLETAARYEQMAELVDESMTRAA